MNTAVYSGSFNPLHIGHQAILEHLAGIFDKVLLVVTPSNPLKDIDAGSGRARLEAARAALARHGNLSDKVEVSDIELTLPLPNYTFRTLDELAARNPGDRLTLVVGGDQIADFRRWREYSRILREYGIIVFPREGTDVFAERDSLLREDPSYRIKIAGAPLVNVSSTGIREALAAGKDVSNLLM